MGKNIINFPISCGMFRLCPHNLLNDKKFFFIAFPHNLLNDQKFFFIIFWIVKLLSHLQYNYGNFQVCM